MEATEPRLDGIDLLFAGDCGRASVGVVSGTELRCGSGHASVFVIPFGDCTHGGNGCREGFFRSVPFCSCLFESSFNLSVRKGDRAAFS